MKLYQTFLMAGLLASGAAFSESAPLIVRFDLTDSMKTFLRANEFDITGVNYNTNEIEALLTEAELARISAQKANIKFSFPQNLCSFIEMANIGTGFIRVTSGGFEFFGFLESATNKPVDPNSGITDFKLILHLIT
jgi:hypothetical protein